MRIRKSHEVEDIESMCLREGERIEITIYSNRRKTQIGYYCNLKSSFGELVVARGRGDEDLNKPIRLVTNYIRKIERLVPSE